MDIDADNNDNYNMDNDADNNDNYNVSYLSSAFN